MFTYVHQKACAWMVRERLCVITKQWNMKMFMNAVMGNYDISYNGIYRIIKMNHLQLCTITWMNFTNTKLRGKKPARQGGDPYTIGFTETNL